MELFAKPIFLLCLIPALALLLFILWLGGRLVRRYQRALFGTSALSQLTAHLHPVSVWKNILLVLCVCFLFVALAGPQWGIEVTEAQGSFAQTVIAVDVSASMRAQDVKPTRLENAKRMLQMLVTRLREDRLGIIAFTSKAFIQCPITTDTDALNYKIPGGMLSNLIAQLRAQNAMDKFEEVLIETPRVREDLGYPPLVTPMSQMVGVQAVTNVLQGERYKLIGKEVKSYLRGEYGKAPGKVNAELKAKALGDEKEVQGRFADTLEPAIEKAKAELGDKAESIEDVLSYIAFPQQAEAYFEAREEARSKRVKYTVTKCED